MTDMRNADADIIEPSIDPKTRKIAIRNVTARNAGGTRTSIQVRDFEPVHTDEPASLGGTNTAPSPLETVLVALVGCDGDHQRRRQGHGIRLRRR